MLRSALRRPALAIVVLAALTLGATPPARAPRGALPPILFVSRRPIAGQPELIPGLGPYARTAAPGGRLLILEPGGALKLLIPAARFFDVSDPCVSWNG